MRHLTALAATAALLSGSSLAAPSANVRRESSPGGAAFQLQLQSSDSTLNGQFLSPCHTGAEMAALCPVSGGDAMYYFSFNASTTAMPYQIPPSTPAVGTLVYMYPSTPSNIPLAMQLMGDSATNLAYASFGPQNTVGTTVGFNKQLKLGLTSFLNDKVNPPVMHNATLVQNWQICPNVFDGTHLNTLTWEYGQGTPTNPGCQGVSVLQVYG